METFNLGFVYSFGRGLKAPRSLSKDKTGSDKGKADIRNHQLQILPHDEIIESSLYTGDAD